MRDCAFFALLLSLLLTSQTCFAGNTPALSELDEGYDQLHERFLKASADVIAKNPAAQSEAIAMAAPDLQIDSLYIPAAQPNETLVILSSGIHGVEAPAGSYIERDFLANCGVQKLHANILIVHTINPYGFKNGRRFNEHNVDLNRNCFDYRANPFPGGSIQNPFYVQQRDFLENKTSATRIAEAFTNKNDIIKAISGQYQFPAGIYYGGNQIEPECQGVERLIEKHMDGVKRVLYFDLHTGYGDNGISQVLLDPAPKDAPGAAAYGREMDILHALFPEAECNGVCSVDPPSGKALITSGDLTGWLADAHPELRRSNLIISETIEIGTEPQLLPIWVLPSIINENYCHWNTSCGPAEEHLVAEQLRQSFIPSNNSWRKQLVKGSAQICRAITRFANEL